MSANECFGCHEQNVGLWFDEGGQVGREFSVIASVPLTSNALTCTLGNAPCEQLTRAYGSATHTHALAHSRTHSLTHSLTRQKPFAHSLGDPPFLLPTRLPISLLHSLRHTRTHTYTHSLIRSRRHPFTPLTITQSCISPTCCLLPSPTEAFTHSLT